LDAVPEARTMTHCDLSHSGLRSIRGVEGLSDLRTLMLAHNDIGTKRILVVICARY
jgi:hypothetical protein